LIGANGWKGEAEKVWQQGLDRRRLNRERKGKGAQEEEEGGLTGGASVSATAGKRKEGGGRGPLRKEGRWAGGPARLKR
jgi:hypothetical protein